MLKRYKFQLKTQTCSLYLRRGRGLGAETLPNLQPSQAKPTQITAQSFIAVSNAPSKLTMKRHSNKIKKYSGYVSLFYAVLFFVSFLSPMFSPFELGPCCFCQSL